MRKILVLLFFIIFTNNVQAVMVKDTCATLVANALATVNPDADPNLIKPYWLAVCEGIIATVKTATVTNSGVCTVASGSSAGPHPTTGTGAIQ